MTDILTISYSIGDWNFPRVPEEVVEIAGNPSNSYNVFLNVSKPPMPIVKRSAIITEELVPLMKSHGLETRLMDMDYVSEEYHYYHHILSLDTKNIIQTYTDSPLSNLPLSNYMKQGDVIFEQRPKYLIDNLVGRPTPDKFKLFVVPEGLEVSYGRRRPNNGLVDKIVLGPQSENLSNQDCVGMLNR